MAKTPTDVSAPSLPLTDRSTDQRGALATITNDDYIPFEPFRRPRGPCPITLAEAEQLERTFAKILSARPSAELAGWKLAAIDRDPI